MPDRQAPSILVLDNGPALSDALHAMLLSAGYRAVTVADLSEALDRASDADLLLCDLRDPRGGLQILAEVQLRDADLPVILVAHAPGVDDVVDALRAGAFDFLRWPIVDISILDRAVVRALEARSLHRDNDRYRAQLEEVNRELAERIRLLHEDEEAGRRVQLRILPESPQDFGWCRVEHRIVPSLYLSGDFVDYFEVGDRQLAFYLADVSGHGASSAFVTMLLKTLGNRARRTISHDPATARRPSMLLALANRELLALGLGKHVSMFCGVVDFARRELYFAVAGQYPQLIVSDGKCAHYAEARGIPVGLFDDALYEDRVHALTAGFSLVLLSDGVMELMNPGSLADKEARLLEMVGGGAVTVDALSRALQLDDQRIVPDDVAILVITDTSTGADTHAGAYNI